MNDEQKNNKKQLDLLDITLFIVVFFSYSENHLVQSCNSWYKHKLPFVFNLCHILQYLVFQLLCGGVPCFHRYSLGNDWTFGNRKYTHSIVFVLQAQPRVPLWRCHQVLFCSTVAPSNGTVLTSATHHCISIAQMQSTVPLCMFC